MFIYLFIFKKLHSWQMTHLHDREIVKLWSLLLQWLMRRTHTTPPQRSPWFSATSVGNHARVRCSESRTSTSTSSASRVKVPFHAAHKFKTLAIDNIEKSRTDFVKWPVCMEHNSIGGFGFRDIYSDMWHCLNSAMIWYNSNSRTRHWNSKRLHWNSLCCEIKYKVKEINH